MDKLENITSIALILGQHIKLNEPLCEHTTFKIGGEAKVFIEISNSNALCELVRLARKNEIKYMILGKGSNLLFDDRGFNGVIFYLGSLFSEVTVSGKTITAQAGASLMSVCKAALENSLSGLEFAYGIPGSIGGAVYMNAGAYGGEIKDVLVSCEVLSESGELITVTAEDMELSYRHSIFQSDKYVILSAKFLLDDSSKKDDISKRMNELLKRRKDKQPVEYPNAGSTFKRPEGFFAGKLIEQSGLRGYTVGRAQVSQKHCGFVINLGGATFKDVTELISYVQKKVLEDSGQFLECEVLIKNYDD